MVRPTYVTSDKVYVSIKFDKTQTPNRPVFEWNTTADDPKAFEKKWVDEVTNEMKSKLVHRSQGLSESTITAIYFDDEPNEYGKRYMKLHLDNTHVLSLDLRSSYAGSLLKRIPGIDITKQVNLLVWSAINDNGKESRGISVKQDGNKITDFFYDYDNKKKLHGMPEMTIEKPTKEDWIAHFEGETLFLESYIKENVIPKMNKADQGASNDMPGATIPEIKPEDIDF